MTKEAQACMNTKTGGTPKDAASDAGAALPLGGERTIYKKTPAANRQVADDFLWRKNGEIS
jgi:hypothetical protein